eukprot:2881022-Prymnesium_polylepis.1
MKGNLGSERCGVGPEVELRPKKEGALARPNKKNACPVPGFRGLLCQSIQRRRDLASIGRSIESSGGARLVGTAMYDVGGTRHRRQQPCAAGPTHVTANAASGSR